MADVTCVILVSNDTLFNGHIEDEILRRVRMGDLHVHVMTPTTSVRSSWTISEGAEEVIATARIREDIRRLRELGATADGEVVRGHLIEAVQLAVAEHGASEVLLSSLAPGISRMIGMDLPHRLERALTVPVIMVEATDRAHA